MSDYGIIFKIKNKQFGKIYLNIWTMKMMNKKNFKKFRIEITTRQHVPLHPKNPYLHYIQDGSRKGNRLKVRVFYDDVEIGHGIILDFYKQFEIIEDFGASHIHIGRSTVLGNQIYRLKYFKNPPLSKEMQKSYIDGFVDSFSPYIEQLKKKTKKNACNCFLTYIPSSTKTPDRIAKKLAKETNIPLVNIVSKDLNDRTDSKNIEEYIESMQHAQKKYLYDKDFIANNADAQYIIIDDVMGLGSSILTTLKTINNITGKINYFLIVVKDVKR